MKNALTLLIVSVFILHSFDLKAQTFSDSLIGFDEQEEIEHILSHDIDPSELEFYLDKAKRSYIDENYELGFYSSPGPIAPSRSSGFDCASGNWDFEEGSLAGWNATGAVQVVNSGVDPYGAYPWVYPGGGNYSAKISGDHSCCKNGRLERVINVPPTGVTLFNFHFAMSIFNFPHTANQAAKLWVEFYDQNGAKLPCPQYECFYSSDQGAVGVSTFGQTTYSASYYNPGAHGDSPGKHPVSYSDWNTVSMDLSGYQNQAITAVFRVRWCTPGPDWAYVLIDIDCPVNSEMIEESCIDPSTGTGELCGPANMATYTWRDANGATLSTSKCFTAPQEGMYTLECLPLNIECTAASLITIEYRVNPLPIPVVDAQNGCIDELVTLAEVGTHQNPLVSWDWLVDGTITETTDNVTVSFPDEGTYPYNLNVVDDKGCTQSVSGSLVVYKNPIADFTFANVCDNESVLGNSTADGQGYTISDYSWDYTNDGADDAAGIQLNYVYPNEGQYDLRHTVVNEHGCSDEVIKQVTIHSLPTADFTVDGKCFQQSNAFADASTIVPVTDDVVSTYTWSFGDGTTGNSASATHAYPAEGIYATQLLITTNKGCKDSITKDAVVYPLPVADFSATEECPQFETSFSDLSTVSNDHTSNTVTLWNWDFANGTISTLQNPGNTYIIDGTYLVDLQIETNHGCQHDTTIAVIVHPDPIADFTFTNACDNEFLVANSTADGVGFQITDYAWDYANDGTDDATGEQLNYVYPTDGQFDLRHTVVNEHGCVDQIVKQVTIHALPVADFTVDPMCFKETNAFSNLSSIVPVTDDAIVTYAWSFGDGTTANTEHTTHAYGGEGVYATQLHITSNKGCLDSITKDAVVYPLPAASFSTPNVCLKFENLFSDLSTVSNAYTSNSVDQWNWNFGDGNGSTVQNPGHFYANDGIYQVDLTVETNNGCQNDTTIEVTVHPKPIADFGGLNLYGCSPICPSLNSISTVNAPSNITHYYWELSDGTTYGNSPNFSDCYENLSDRSEFYGVQLIVETNEGCLDTLNKEDYIEVFHNPIAKFYYTPDEPNVMDPVIDFHNTSLYADSYAWTIDYFGQTNEVNPSVEFPFEPVSYPAELIAYTDQGCSDTARTIVTILDKIIFYVPNTFTPDNDKFNETFQPVFAHGFDPNDFTLYIFNRWGELVFESHDTTIGWPGTYGSGRNDPVMEGTYIWKIEFKETMSDKRHTHTGHVNLLR